MNDAFHPKPRNKGDDAPDSGLEYRQRIVSPQTDDEFLSENNLGLGVYGDREYWQQVENYNQYLYAQAAFEDYLLWLANSVTRKRVRDEGFSYTYMDQSGSPEEVEIEPWDQLSDEKKRKAGKLPDYAERLLRECSDDQEGLVDTPDRRVDTRYDELPGQAKLQAIRQFTSYDPGRRAPQGRVIMGRHEMSRSKGGRLISAATTDSKEIVRDERPQGPVNS